MSSVLVYFALAGKIIQYGWPFALLLYLVICKMRWKNWPIDVVIIEKRGDNLIKTNDRGGMFNDQFTGLKGYKLLKNKDTIPAVNYDWILHSASKPTNILEKLVGILRPTQGTLFLFKYGAKQYKPLPIKENKKAEKEKYDLIKDETTGKTIYVDVYQQFDPRGHLPAIHFEIVDWDNMNFMVQEMRASFERRQKKNTWMKTILVPLAMMAVTAMVCIVMMKFSLDFASSPPTQGGQVPTPSDPSPDIPLISDVIPGK